LYHAEKLARPGTNENEFKIGPNNNWYIRSATWENSRRIGNSAATRLWAVVGGALAQSISGLQRSPRMKSTGQPHAG
jgi:hypothetical protein